jgi:hypothetical protein
VTPEFVFKIYVSTRNSPDEPFGPRVILDPPINSDGHAYEPELTPNGRRMFFFAAGSDNPFAPGAINHIYVSERRNKHKPWGAPIYLDTSIARPVSEGCPPSAETARRYAGWAIGETALATRMSIAHGAVKPATSASLQTPFGSGALVDFLGAIEGRMACVHKYKPARSEKSQSFGDVQHPEDVHENWACSV